MTLSLMNNNVSNYPILHTNIAAHGTMGYQTKAFYLPPPLKKGVVAFVVIEFC
jgi:hypothetical protein